MYKNKAYLGDGLYVHDDGYHVVLIAPRGHENHECALDDQVLEAFFMWLEKARGLKITIEKVTPNEKSANA